MLLHKSTNLGFIGKIEELFIRYWSVEVGSEQVGSEAFWWFVGHFNSILQDGHREVG